MTQTQQTTQHTPGTLERLPGKVDTGNTIYPPGKVLIRLVMSRESVREPFVRVALVDSDRPWEDAERLVRCWNCHDELLAVLQMVVRHAPASGPLWYGSEQIAAARAAIAKATEPI